MSFKDVRDLSEHLKLLGYPNAFPLSLLYTTYGGPNSFRIVADILQWLAERFEPGTVLTGGTKDSTERISLIRSAAEFFITKATIKLNPRKLYISSSVAATELLKITSLLMNAPTEIDVDEEQYKNNNVNIDLDDKIDDLRRARELSTDLTNIGATLYDLLSKELLNKETRTVQATRSLELVSVERSLKTAITLMNQKLQTSKLQLETSRNEKNALQSKLDRKSSDLERLKQRLEALHKIRPAYLEEFERLEIDLKNLYDQYFIRVRCLDALRTQLQSRVKTPTAPTIITAIPLTSKPHENSMNFLPDGLIIDSDDENILIDDDDGDDFGIGDDDDDDDNVFKKNVKNNLQAASNLLNKNENKDDSNVRPTTNNRLRIRTGIPRTRFVGSMTGNSGGGGGGGGTADGASDLDSSDDSESDLDIVDDLRSDDDELIAKLTASPTITSKINKTDHRSDEDF